MVHYDPALTTLPQPPPTCPKCGSHRTQIVGLSNDGQTIILRCNACGERSEVTTLLEERAANPLPPVNRQTFEEWQYT